MKNKKNEIKTDRRVAFTKSAIRDTLIEEIKQVPFEEIGIVSLCEKAQISRSAFYLHFGNLYEVLEEVVMDAVETNPALVNVILGDYVTSRLEFANENECYKSAAKYVGILKDKTASNILCEYLIKNYKAEYIKNVSDRHGISQADAEFIFYFQTIGLIAAANEVKSKSTKRWLKLGDLRDKLMEQGLKGLAK